MTARTVEFRDGRLVWPISEMVDRYSILRLKLQRLPASDAIRHECARLEADLSARTGDGYKRHLEGLQVVNSMIWDLEADIRNGAHGLSLAEVGRRALDIRSLNAERVRLKNAIAAEFGEFEDVKVDHASA